MTTFPDSSRVSLSKEELIPALLALLQDTLDQQGAGEAIPAESGSPLIGGEAVVTSLRLVSFIADVETLLADDYGWTVTLVSEQALSRTRSPFRSVETLAAYIVELAASRRET